METKSSIKSKMSILNIFSIGCATAIISIYIGIANPKYIYRNRKSERSRF